MWLIMLERGNRTSVTTQKLYIIESHLRQQNDQFKRSQYQLHFQLLRTSFEL